MCKAAPPLTGLRVKLLTDGQAADHLCVLALVTADTPNTIRGGVTALEASPAEWGRNMGSPDLVVYAVPALAGVAGCLTAELAIVGEP